MSLGLNKNPKFRQGYYRCKFPKKYIGKEVPIYRSGIELKFFNWVDNNDNVIEWLSEGLIIPYFDSVKKCNRKYYTDAYIKIKEGDKVKRYVIEIKDLKETIKPDPKSKKKKTTLIYEQIKFCNNSDKWKFSDEFCKKNNMEFLLLGFSKKNGFERVNHLFQ